MSVGFLTVAENTFKSTIIPEQLYYIIFYCINIKYFILFILFFILLYFIILFYFIIIFYEYYVLYIIYYIVILYFYIYIKNTFIKCDFI